MERTVRRQEPQESGPTGRARRASGRRSRGQAVVEFALILPVFLLLTLGVVDLARIFSAYSALNNGVREAALWAADGTSNSTSWCADPPTGTIPCPGGAVPGHVVTTTDNIAYQIERDATGLVPSQITMQTPICVVGGIPGPCGPTTTTVTISASYPAPLLTPVLSNILGGAVTLSASTTAQVVP